MAEIDFERRLERLFDEAPGTADADAFARRVEQRLDRGWILRRWLIGSAGVAGGLIAASQLLMSDLAREMQHAEGSVRLLSSGLAQATPGIGWVTALPYGGTGLWIAAGLAVVSLGFVLSRVIEEI
jgi:hypothetical protein